MDCEVLIMTTMAVLLVVLKQMTYQCATWLPSFCQSIFKVATQYYEFSHLSQISAMTLCVSEGIILTTDQKDKPGACLALGDWVCGVWEPEAKQKFSMIT